MAKNYYTLVAGLREFTFESDRKGFDAKAIVRDIRSELDKADRRYLELFYSFYDIENVVNIKAGRSGFSHLANLSHSQLNKVIQRPEYARPWAAAVMSAYDDPENPEYDTVDHTQRFEKAFYGAYYAECARSRCRFVKEWYEFDRNLRNVAAAYTARRLEVPVREQIVGGGYVAEMLAKSSAADFGLGGELDYLDEVMSAVQGESNLLEKERRIDMVRWAMSDELTPFDYFNINTILAYLVKVNIVYRWMALDEEKGREMFEKLMASFSERNAAEKIENEEENK